MTAEAPVGGRSARRAARRRRQRQALLGAALLLVLAGLVAAVWLLQPLDGGAGGGGRSPVASEAPDQRTLLLVRAPAEPGPALGMTLLAAGPRAGDGAVLFLPVGTLIDIPGHGLDRLGASYQYGGAPLAEAAVENALGIQVDDTAALTDAALGAWLNAVGTVEIDVPARLVQPSGAARPGVRFAAGPQALDGPRLVEYLGFRQAREDELQTFSRQEQVWDGIFGVIADADEPRRPARSLAAAPQLDPGLSEEALGSLFALLGEARATDALRQAVLPVDPFGGDGPDGGPTYRLRQPDARELVAELLGPSARETGGDRPRVEVLNGVGTPGIGQAVHRRLQGRFRIVRTDNANRFDYADTRILVYDRDRLADARRLRTLLGVGTISVSRRPQSVVDLTVVVGADFLEVEGRSS